MRKGTEGGACTRLPSMLSRRLLPVPLVLLALVVAGCGDDNTAEDVTEATSTAQTTATEAEGGSGTAPSVEQIAEVPGVGPRTAAAIKEAVAQDGTSGQTGPRINTATGEIEEN